MRPIHSFLLATLAALPVCGFTQTETPPAAAAPAEAAAQAPVIQEAPPQIKGNAVLKGKRFYIAEYRVLFEVGGSATASTRAGYMPGMDFGATRVTVAYQVAKPNLELFQAITDKAYADFLAK
ncbi:MAG: hypothetical protein EOO21_01475, partial [Comamonadaceae bacterium]